MSHFPGTSDGCSTSSVGLTAHWLSRWEDITALRSDWTEMVEAFEARTVFERFEWFDAAWQWAGEDSQPRVLAIRAGQRLIGIFPARLSVRQRGPLGVRTLSFVSVPDTQFCDLLASADWRDAVASSVAQALCVAARDWDLLELGYLSDAFPNWRALHARLLESRLAVQVLPAGRNLRISLDQPWSSYYSSRSRSLKKKNNLAANRLERAGALQVQWLRNREVTDAVLDEAIGISASSWKGTTAVSLDKPGPRAFVRRLSELASEHGWLSVWLLRIDGKVVATEYQLIFDGSVHALRSDFAQTHSAMSPGSYLNWKLLERLFGADLRQYLMGPGENAYKLQWASEGPSMFQLQAFSPTLRGRALYWLDMHLKPLLRAARDRFRHVFGRRRSSIENEQ